MDRYFTKNMDHITCKRILEGVKELEQSSDWFVINRDVVNKQASADVARALDIILSEYEVFVKSRVQSIGQAIDQEQEF